MHDDMHPDNMNTMPQGQTDREGAMAKADLYKLANYSLKLFKKIQDEDQLEGWVQAKITKAADYVASVYHYLEYEMKISEYGEHLANAEVYNESQKIAIVNKLMEAKEKVKELKKLQAEKLSKDGKAKKVEEGILSGGERPCSECGGSGMVYEEPKAVPDHVKGKVEKYKRLTKAMHAANKRLDKNNNGIPDNLEDKEVDEEFGGSGNKEMKVGDTKKTRTGELTKTATGVIHKNTSYKDEGDEIASNAKSGKGIKSHAKAQSAAEKKDRAPAQKQSPKSAKTWGMKDGAKFDNRDGAEKPAKKEKAVDEMFGQGVYEAKKKGDGNLANNAKPYDKVTKGDVIAGRLGKDEEGGKKDAKVAEAKKPSAGLTKAEKSATVKSAKAGKDIGKPGKNFDKVAKAAGGGEKGEKIAAAAMWKNKAKAVKESLKQMLPQLNEAEEMDTKATVGLATFLAKVDKENFQKALAGGDKAFFDYLQANLQKGLVQPSPEASAEVDQEIARMQGDVTDQSADDTGTDVANTEPKDMPVSGDTEAEEGVVTDFVAGGANAIGHQVGSVVRDVKQAGQDLKQFGTTVADAAKAGYNQATGNSYATGAKMGTGVQGVQDQPATTKQTGITKQDRNLRESNETTRMREQLARLNQHENIVVKESNEVDQIRALTKRLLG